MVDESPAITPLPLRTDTQNRRALRFNHGYYLDNSDIVTLLFLFTSPCTTRSGRQLQGVPYSFALLACGIISDNNFTNTYLATRSYDGGPLSPVPPDNNEGILKYLPDREYYFMVSRGDGEGCKRYPIVPNFRSWSFPHGQLPGLWDTIQIPTERHIERSPCVVTGDYNSTQRAHIIPRCEEKWFKDNRMDRYCPGYNTREINSPRNIISLRADIHVMFEKPRQFVILPSTLVGSEAMVWKTWEFAQADHDHSKKATYRYHNRATVVPLEGISKEFIFARLAWSLLGSSMIKKEMDTPRGGIRMTVGSGSNKTIVEAPGNITVARRSEPKMSGPAGIEYINQVEEDLRERGIDIDEFIYVYYYLNEAGPTYRTGEPDTEEQTLAKEEQNDRVFEVEEVLRMVEAKAKECSDFPGRPKETGPTEQGR